MYYSDLFRRSELLSASVSNSWFLPVFVTFFTIAGCWRGQYSRSVYGTVGGYSLENANPKPTSLMVARKIERPLFIVLDANQVKDTWTLETSACATRRAGCERFKLMNVKTVFRERRKTLWIPTFKEKSILSLELSGTNGFDGIDACVA